MRELFYGGWTAKNIYFMGSSGVIDVQINGTTLTIGGISGIKGRHHDYRRGFFETFPYNHSTLRSVYHYREYEIEKFKLFDRLKGKCDLFMSHEWPEMVTYKS